MRSHFSALLVLGAGLLAAPPAPAAQESAADGQGEQDIEIIIESEELSQRILVAPFTATTRDSTGLAASLYEFLFGELMAAGQHDLLELADCQPVEDVDAPLYYSGCPPGDELGCQFVIGERSQIERVVSGRVTALEDGDFRVAVTILDVDKAELALTYVLDLRADEEILLPRTVLLTLDNLKQQELDAPYEDARERQRARMRMLEEARSEEEQRLVARMKIDLREGELERLETELRKKPEQYLSQADIETMKTTEGGEAVWKELGITSKQYRSLKNSGLDFEKWRWRWAGHRLQLLGTIQVGFIGGATGLRYSGGYYLSPNLEREVDNFAWQQVTEGSSMSLGFGIGFGILRNLDIEVAGMWSRSKVYIRLLSGSTIPDEDNANVLVPDPTNRPSGTWSEQSVNLFGGEVMLRYYFLTVPKLRPSLGAGFAWLSYPSLYNDPEVADDEESPPPPIRGQFKTFRRVVDFGPQIEPGVQLDLNRWVGIFLRVPITFAANPKRLESHRFVEDGEVFSDAEALPDSKAPFGIVRVVVGVQGRLFGMPVRPKQDYSDDMLDEDVDVPARPDDGSPAGPGEQEQGAEDEPPEADGQQKPNEEETGSAEDPKSTEQPGARDEHDGEHQN